MNQIPVVPRSVIKKRRPLSAAALSISMWVFSVIHFYQLALRISYLDSLKSFPLLTPTLYLFAAPLIWGTVGLILGLGLWMGLSWGSNATLIGLVVFSIVTWAQKAIFYESGWLFPNWPFLLGVNILLIGIVFLIMRSNHFQHFFGEINEGKNPP